MPSGSPATTVDVTGEEDYRQYLPDSSDDEAWQGTELGIKALWIR